MAKDDSRKWEYKIENPYHHMEVVKSVQHFNMRDSFVDLCFVCAQGVKVKAHKLLLCSLSTHMKTMLLELPDCVVHDMVTVHIPDIDSGTLHLVLDFLYEGCLKVSEARYPEIQAVMDTLGIVLTNNSEEPQPGTSEAVPPQPNPTPALPITQPTPQVGLVYLPTTSNSQGQMQYVLAAQTGQIIQSTAQQQVSTQPVFMLQAGAQQSNREPMIIEQANRHMFQSGAQVMTTQPQQNLIPVMQQSNQLTNQQMAPNNQQIGNNQGNLLALQPSIMNNNHMQVSMQNQVTNSNYTVNQPVVQPRSQASKRQYNQIAQPQGSSSNHTNTIPDVSGVQHIGTSLASVSQETVRPVLEELSDSDDQDINDIVVEFLKESLQDCNDVKEVPPFNKRKRCDTSLNRQRTCRSLSKKSVTNGDDFDKKGDINLVNLLSDDTGMYTKLFKQQKKNSLNPKPILISQVFSYADQKVKGEQSYLFCKDDLGRKETHDEDVNEEETSIEINKTTINESFKRPFKTKPKKRKPLVRKRKNFDMDVPCRLSPELTSLLGENVLTRKQALKAVLDYTVRNGLALPGRSRDILCDQKLSEVVKTGKTTQGNLRYMICCTKKHLFQINN